MMDILILDESSRFEDDDGESKTKKLSALIDARDSIGESPESCFICSLVTVEGFVEEFKSLVDSGSDLYALIHKSDLDNSSYLKTLLDLGADKGIKVVLFSGATNGVVLDRAVNCSRIFAISRGIGDPIFDTQEIWQEVLSFLLRGEPRPSVIADNPVSPPHAAALILLQGYQLISQRTDWVSNRLDVDQYLEKVIEQAKMAWMNMSVEQKSEYWAPVVKNAVFIEHFDSLQVVINNSKISDVDKQVVDEAIDAIRVDAGLR